MNSIHFSKFVLIYYIIQTLGFHLSSTNIFRTLNSQIGSHFLTFSLFLESLFKLQIATWILLFHLMYFGVSYRILNLKFLILQPVSFDLNSHSCVTKHQLQKVTFLIDKLAKASYHLQCIYSIPVLVILCAFALNCAISVFVIIQELVQPTSSRVSVSLHLFSFLLYTLFAMIVILSVDLPLEAVAIFLSDNL